MIMATLPAAVRLLYSLAELICLPTRLLNPPKPTPCPTLLPRVENGPAPDRHPPPPLSAGYVRKDRRRAEAHHARLLRPAAANGSRARPSKRWTRAALRFRCCRSPHPAYGWAMPPHPAPSPASATRPRRKSSGTTRAASAILRRCRCRTPRARCARSNMPSISSAPTASRSRRTISTSYPGDEAFRPVFEELDRRKAVVYFHPTAASYAFNIIPGVPPPTLEFPFDTTRAIASLLFSGTFHRCPNIKWIFSHGGGALAMFAHRLSGPRQEPAGDWRPRAEWRDARVEQDLCRRGRRHVARRDARGARHRADVAPVVRLGLSVLGRRTSR